jgi:hypothetical protein
MSNILELIDDNGKRVEVQIYPCGPFGWACGHWSAQYRYIAEIAEKHKMDAKKFLVIFGYYKPVALTDYKDLTVKEIDNTRDLRVKIFSGSSEDVIINKPDIEWLIDFSKRLMKEMEEKDNIKEIFRKAETVKGGGNLHDVLNDYEYKCDDAYPCLQGFIDIGKKALELGAKIRFG